MKTIQNKKIRVSKKATLIGATILVAGIGLAILYSSWSSKDITPPKTVDTEGSSEKKVNDINLDSPTDQQVQTGNDAKKDTIDNSASTTSEAPFTATINTNQDDRSILKVRSLISALSSSGTCELTLSQGDKIITKTAGIQAQASSSTCMGFDIPVSELSSGDWVLSLKVSIGAQTSANTKTVTVL